MPKDGELNHCGSPCSPAKRSARPSSALSPRCRLSQRCFGACMSARFTGSSIWTAECRSPVTGAAGQRLCRDEAGLRNGGQLHRPRRRLCCLCSVAAMFQTTIRYAHSLPSRVRASTSRSPGWVKLTTKTYSSCCNRVACTQVLGRNCILPNCTACCQRPNVRCKRRSSEKNRLTSMGSPRSACEASAPQVHRVWKRPCPSSLGPWLALVACPSLVTACFSSVLKPLGFVA
jgi:hypothetical protein